MNDQSMNVVNDAPTADSVDTLGRSKRTASYMQFLNIVLVILGLGQLVGLIQLAMHERGGLFKTITNGVSDNVIKIYQNAVTGDPLVKAELTSSVRTHARAYADIEPWKMIVPEVIRLSKYAVFFITFLLFRAWAQKYYLSINAGIQQSILLSAMRLALILLLVLVLVGLPLQVLIAYVFQIKKIKTVDVISFVIKVSSKLPAVIVLIYIIIFAELQRRSFREGLDLNRQTYYLALLFTLAVILFMRTVSLLSHICNHLFDRFRSHRCADSVIVVHLLSLVESLRVSKDYHLSDSRQRRTAIGLLEDVALRFEVFLPKQIVGTDLSSLPLQRDLAKIGGGIRALKQRVAIPTSNMWDEKLRRDLSQFLIDFLSLNWAALPTDETQLRSSVTVVSKVKAFVRSIMTGAIPAILLAIVQVSPFRLTRQRAEVALLVAAAWFAISVLLRLDPEFAAKMQALEKVQQIVNPNIKP